MPGMALLSGPLLQIPQPCAGMTIKVIIFFFILAHVASCIILEQTNWQYTTQAKSTGNIYSDKFNHPCHYFSCSPIAIPCRHNQLNLPVLLKYDISPAYHYIPAHLLQQLTGKI